MENNHKFTTSHSGFRKKQIYKIIDKTVDAIDSGENLMSCLLDLSKALSNALYIVQYNIQFF